MPRQSATWLITDTHFFHDMLVEKCGRPADYMQRILRGWRMLVAPQDEVIHLGDVILYQLPKLEGILDDLPGRKILVMGNHDYRNKTRRWYMNHGFDFACDSIVVGDVLLNHKPVSTLPEGVRICVHGHLHNTGHHTEGVAALPHNRLLAIECTDYRPVRLDHFARETQ